MDANVDEMTLAQWETVVGVNLTGQFLCSREAVRHFKERGIQSELVPYNRIGEPLDIGNAAVWLASDHSDYVTGTTIVVDGGMTLYPGFATGG